MDIQPQTTQPISDDQELAKVLAGVNTEADVEETPQAPGDIPAPIAPDTPPPVAAPAEEPVVPPMPAVDPMTPVVPAPSGELDSVKQEAISELRPLVDKLNLPAEEKFDTYLLLIRSTDDRTLIAPAHEAAKAIADEARRAQALLDIIKEIDFLNNSNQNAG